MKINNRLLAADDENVIIACADLAGRSGARKFEIGYLHDNVPTEQAGWYAFAAYRGARITVSDQPGPTQTALALARRILTGAKCRCGRLVALSDTGAFAFSKPTLADGTPWPVEQAAEAGQCRWRLIGRTWTPPCPAPADGQSKIGGA